MDIDIPGDIIAATTTVPTGRIGATTDTTGDITDIMPVVDMAMGATAGNTNMSGQSISGIRWA